MDEHPQVTILSEYFHPEEASTAQLLTNLTTGLIDRFSVGVITALPNYHDEDQETAVPRNEVYEGVDVRRVRATRFDKDCLPLRVMNWLSFTLLTLIRLLTDRRSDDARVVLSNPPILPLAAMLAKRLDSTPYVYVIYDMYPEMPIELDYLDEDSLPARLWFRLMGIVYRDADRIVVLGDSMDRKLREKMADDPDFDDEKIVSIPNWENPNFIEPMDKDSNDFAREQGFDDTFTVLYSGNIGRFHELETAIDAINELESRGREDIQLVIIGDGARKESLQEYVQQRDIDNVHFLPFQPLKRIPQTLTSGDVSLVGIKPRMEGLCVSSKLYSSLAAGMPVLAVVGEGDEVARVVREQNCGRWVESGDAVCAADVLESWADNPELCDRLGTNARDCLEDKYTQYHAINTYASVLDDLTATS